MEITRPLKELMNREKVEYVPTEKYLNGYRTKLEDLKADISANFWENPDIEKDHTPLYCVVKITEKFDKFGRIVSVSSDVIGIFSTEDGALELCRKLYGDDPLNLGPFGYIEDVESNCRCSYTINVNKSYILDDEEARRYGIV